VGPFSLVRDAGRSEIPCKSPRSGQRTVMGLAKKAAKGEWTGGTPPFGYGYDSDQSLLVAVPEEAIVVEDIFKRYASRRHGSAAISGWLNDEAINTKRGGKWTPQRVIDPLRNTMYIGELPFKGESCPSQHEAIVDEISSTWHRLSSTSAASATHFDAEIQPSIC
jgi:site-specific DNA recombinase